MGFFTNLFSKKSGGSLDHITLRQFKEEHGMHFLVDHDNQLDMAFGEWMSLKKIKPHEQPKYKTIHMEIDDEFINNHDPFDAIEPVLWTIDHPDDARTHKKAFKYFTTPQRYVYAILQYSAEVNNGGHDQFYFNSAGVMWEDAFKAFDIIGAKRNIDILKESADRMGGKPSKNRKKRQDYLEKHSPEFDDLDDLYYESEGGMIQLLHTYVKDNAKEFYFSGDVTMLEVVASKYENKK